MEVGSMTNHKQMNMLKDIMTSIEYLLEQGQNIPLSEDELGVVGQMVSKEGDKYFLFERDLLQEEFNVRLITQEDAEVAVYKYFERKTLAELKEEMTDWKNCAAAFKEEEERGNVLFALPNSNNARN